MRQKSCMHNSMNPPPKHRSRIFIILLFNWETSQIRANFCRQCGTDNGKNPCSVEPLNDKSELINSIPVITRITKMTIYLFFFHRNLSPCSNNYFCWLVSVQEKHCLHVNIVLNRLQGTTKSTQRQVFPKANIISPSAQALKERKKSFLNIMSISTA